MASASPCVRELGEMYELVEEVLIRIPPDEPAGLIRASLVCKAWCGLVSGHAFRSHYRVFHKTPPILGFLQSWEDEHERFVPTTRFRPRNCKLQDRFVLDCRHCRVLLMCYYDEDADEDEDEDDEEEDDDDGEEEDDYEEYEAMVVWDPLSGRRTKLHNPDIFNPLINGTNYSATVLCAADGCNHDACNLAPFLVAFVVLDYKGDRKKVVWASVYSSETQEWTSSASIHVGSVGTLGAGMVGRPGVLVGQALHFLLDRYEGHICIIKYDLGSHRLSVIDLPGLCVSMRPLLVLSEDGRLGVVDFDRHRLCYMWLVEVSIDGVASWIKLREMNFGMLLPLGNPRSSDSLWFVGCVEGTDILVVATNIGAFTIELKSLRWRKLSTKPYKDTYLANVFGSLFLYTSFNNPPAVAGVMAVAEAKQDEQVK